MMMMMIVGHQCVAFVKRSWSRMTHGHVADVFTGSILSADTFVEKTWCVSTVKRTIIFQVKASFEPPLTDAALRYNIANGVTVAGSSKLTRLRHHFWGSFIDGDLANWEPEFIKVLQLVI
eukprot:4235722-Amphidinium_carterae.1